MTDLAAVIEAALSERGIEFDRVRPDAFVVNLPGERRLKTACWLTIGEHALSIDAFVVRKPDENHEGFYRWLLQHNAKTYIVSWSIDSTGDVYLTGRLPLHAVDADELDRVLGAVLEYADGAFNELLKLGFGSSIRREWAWRTKNDMPTTNLAAFASFVEATRSVEAGPTARKELLVSAATDAPTDGTGVTPRPGRGLLVAIWSVTALVLVGLAAFVVRYALAGGSGHAMDHTLFAAGEGPQGTSLLGSQLFTAWQLDTTAVAFVVLLAGLYAAGIVALRRRSGQVWPLGRIVAFGIGLLVIVFATCGSIAVYDQTLFSAHMVGHLALVMLAPALLVAGAPLTLWRETRRDPARFDRVAKGSVLAVLTSPPVAFACYTVVIVGTHLTGLMDLIMDSTSLGQLEHLAYLVIGFQFFLLVIGDEPIRWRLSLLGRIGILGVGMAVDTFTGVVLLAATVPISMGVGVDALTDTKTGGAIMWVGGDGLMAVVMVLLVVGYLRRPQEGGREEKSWVEQARRGVFEEKTGERPAPAEPNGNLRAAVPATAEDFDEDDRRREAYNRWLEKLENSGR